MPDASIFQIENGVLAFELVDVNAVGYQDTWQAPGGATLSTVTIDDYNADGVTSNWSCQVTSGMLTPSANANDVSVPATFCNPARTIPQPGETSFTLDVEFLQQVAIATGLDAFLYANDTVESYFLLGLAGTVTTPAPGVNAPKAIGRCRLAASAFGGPAREQLTATISLPLSRRADIAYGSGATVTLVGGFTAPAAAAASSSEPASEPEPVAVGF